MKHECPFDVQRCTYHVRALAHTRPKPGQAAHMARRDRHGSRKAPAQGLRSTCPLTPERHQPPFHTSPCLNGDSCSASLNASANSCQSMVPLLSTSAVAKIASTSCGASGMFQFESARRTSSLSRRPLRSWVEVGVGWGRGSGQDRAGGRGWSGSGVAVGGGRRDSRHWNFGHQAERGG